MRVAGYDPGFNFGYGVLERGKPALSGSHKIPGSGRRLGAALNHVERWLLSHMREHKPDVVVIAIPFISRKATPTLLRPLMSFAGMVEKVADTLRIDCKEIQESDARLAFLGSVPRKSKAIKAAIMASCEQRGWPCADDHAGDALCVAEFCLAILDPLRAHENTPLFVERQFR